MSAAGVLIVGAGPAGAALAIQLARQGRAVTLVDRAGFPREKPCGEGVMPGGLAELARLGIEVPAQPYRGVRYRQSGGAAAVEGLFPGCANGAGIRRRDLDAALCAAARAEPNVEWIGGAAVTGPWFDAAGRVRGVRTADGRQLPARLTVAADGAASPLRHALGWDGGSAILGRNRFGVRRHFRLAAGKHAPEFVTIFLDGRHEAYLTPLTGGEVGLAVLSASAGEPAARLFGRVTAADGELRELLADAQPVSSPLGASPLTVRARRRVGPGLVLLGDAAGNCDPIAGTGITQALRSARLLADTFAGAGPDGPTADALSRFDQRREEMAAGYRRLSLLMLAVLRNRPLASVSLRALAAFPWIFTRLIGVANRAWPDARCHAA